MFSVGRVAGTRRTEDSRFYSCSKRFIYSEHFSVLLPRTRSQVHFVPSHIKRTWRMNRQNKGGKKNRKINRITVLYRKKNIEICLIMFAAINTDWWYTCTEITQQRNALCQNSVTVCGRDLFPFTLTLWLGRPGGTHENPSKTLFSLEGLRCGSVGGLNPRRSRTLTHSSWYTSWASLGHLQLLHVFLKEQRKKLISRIYHSRRSELPSSSQACDHRCVLRIPTNQMHWLTSTPHTHTHSETFLTAVSSVKLTEKRRKYVMIKKTHSRYKNTVSKNTERTWTSAEFK